MFTSLIIRLKSALWKLTQKNKLAEYVSKIDDGSPLKGINSALIVNSVDDPTEMFSHYDAFTYWVFKKLKPNNQKILDVGSTKVMVSLMSIHNEVTSVVLSDCSDSLTEVNYCYHDVSERLPFPNSSFTCFTSLAVLHLIGMGRYGDKPDPNCWYNFMSELDRVMTKKADLFVSICFGPNFLAFNRGYHLDLDMIKKVFSGWELIDCLVDMNSTVADNTLKDINTRFVKPENAFIEHGDYRVIFCHFSRNL